jgi:hypothetical protein
MLQHLRSRSLLKDHVANRAIHKGRVEELSHKPGDELPLVLVEYGLPRLCRVLRLSTVCVETLQCAPLVMTTEQVTRIV